MTEHGQRADDGDEVLGRLPEDLPGEAMSELHACEVELASPVAPTADAAVGALAGLRAAVVATGARPIGCGLQPAAAGDEPAITPKSRYRRIRELLGHAAADPE